jgi:hypothetical protein
MLQSRCRVLLASFMSSFAAKIRRRAMALGGILMLLRSGMVRFDDVGFFIHEKLLIDSRMIPGRVL